MSWIFHTNSFIIKIVYLNMFYIWIWGRQILLFIPGYALVYIQLICLYEKSHYLFFIVSRLNWHPSIQKWIWLFLINNATTPSKIYDMGHIRQTELCLPIQKICYEFPKENNQANKNQTDFRNNKSSSWRILQSLCYNLFIHLQFHCSPILLEAKKSKNRKYTHCVPLCHCATMQCA